MELTPTTRLGHGALKNPSKFSRSLPREPSMLRGNRYHKVIGCIKRRAIVPNAVGVEGMADTDNVNVMIDESEAVKIGGEIGYEGIHHVGLLCKNLEVSLEFYQGLLGLSLNPDRPNKKLPYRGAWLWIGSEMIHLMELPNPDPSDGRPEHGGRDRHFCVAIKNLEPLAQALDKAKVAYTRSMSGRPAIFFRDPDMNCLECVELSPSA